MQNSIGNFFEDFRIGQTLDHPTPRTIREADLANYIALTGSRFLLQSSELAARSVGLKASPLDDLMTFHIVFGKSVPDISQNAIANLGYAQCLFHKQVFPGDTISARSQVIGLKENSSGQTGIVYVKTCGYRDQDELVLEFIRWVMIRKRVSGCTGIDPVIPKFESVVSGASLANITHLSELGVCAKDTGSKLAFEDYSIAEKIDHVAGMGVQESEHRLATRLYQNTANVHFDDFSQRNSRLGSVIVYGGVVMSVARSLSFNGLANCLRILAINSGRHVNPCHAGSTLFAWTEILDKVEINQSSGALRLRLIALKDHEASSFLRLNEDGSYRDEVLLELDYWVQIPKSKALR